MGDRGFADQKLYEFLKTELGFDYIIRFCGGITVTDTRGDSRTAREWVPQSARTLKLRDAKVTQDGYQVGAVVVKKDDGIKDAWCWATRRQRLYVNSTSPPLARKLTCFGFYALAETEPVRIGTVSWANGDTTCQMLRALKASYPHRRLVLIWDNVRYHHALAVRRCAEELGIQLEYLPPYSPDLMPAERLWQWLRQEVTALHCHHDEDELRERIAAFEAQLNDEPRAVHTRLRPKTRLDP